jgi:uncharacterized protein (DUF433 family)
VPSTWQWNAWLFFKAPKSLFDHLEAGDSIEDFLEGFPSVRREQVLEVLEESREHALAAH